MKFHVLTLFPEMILGGMMQSVIGKAVEKKIISLDATNIRDFTQDKHGKVDDYPYGGGAGMLMQAQPVYDAWKAVSNGKRIRTIYLTPQGKVFDHAMAREFAREEDLVFLCGHYEGIDERVLEEVVTDFVSIGDFVLTGGELPAMVMMDAIARFVPGVLGNETSAESESFFNDLLEYPQYSRPEIWEGKNVPEVLLSGNHKNVEAWRLEQAKERTRENRPDLYAKYERKQSLIKRLSKNKRTFIPAVEFLARGLGEILYEEKGSFLLVNRERSLGMLHLGSGALEEEIRGKIPEETKEILVFDEETKDFLEKHGFCTSKECFQYLYTEKIFLKVRKPVKTPEEIVSLRSDGGMQFSPVAKQESLETCATAEASLINCQVEQGFTPYIQIECEDNALCALQEKLGLYQADKKITWMEKV